MSNLYFKISVKHLAYKFASAGEHFHVYSPLGKYPPPRAFAYFCDATLQPGAVKVKKKFKNEFINRKDDGN